MSEPTEIAPAIELVAEGIWHWRINNSAIGGHLSGSHAVLVDGDEATGAGCVLVDPVRLDPHAMQGLPPMRAIVLTSRGHQRAAWRYRDESGVPVWAPEGVEGADEQPDMHYTEGDELPGGLRAVHTPGPEQHHFSLHLPSRSALLVADLVSRGVDGPVTLVPPELHEDPEATRASVRRLLDLEFELLLLDHGPPVTDDARGALARALADDDD